MSKFYRRKSELTKISHRIRIAALVVWSWLFILVFTVCSQAKANDVYNFYFQKSPEGSKSKVITTNSGGVTNVEDSASSGAAGAGNASVSQVQMSSVQPEAVPKWEISIGHSWDQGDNYAYAGVPGGGWNSTESSFKSYGLTFQYNFNKWIGTRLGYSYVKQDFQYYNYTPSIGTEDFGGLSLSNKFEFTEHTGSLGAIFTPVRVEAKSHDFLTVGAGFGIARTLDREIKFYVEPEVSLFFVKNAGARILYRYMLDNERTFIDNKFDAVDTKTLTLAMVARF